MKRFLPLRRNVKDKQENVEVHHLQDTLFLNFIFLSSVKTNLSFSLFSLDPTVSATGILKTTLYKEIYKTYCLCIGSQPIVFSNNPISIASFANLLLSLLSLNSDVLAILGTEKKTDIKDCCL